MSSTPRTDAAAFTALDTVFHPGEPMECVSAEKAREFERENAALRGHLDAIGNSAGYPEVTERAQLADTIIKRLVRLSGENAAMRAFVEMVALDRDDRASPGLKNQASLMLQDLAAGRFNPDR